MNIVDVVKTNVHWWLVHIHEAFFERVQVAACLAVSTRKNGTSHCLAKHRILMALANLKQLPIHISRNSDEDIGQSAENFRQDFVKTALNDAIVFVGAKLF